MLPQNQLLKRYSQEHLVRAMCGTPCSRRQVLQLLHAMVCNDYGVMAHPVAEGRCYISRQIPDCSDLLNIVVVRLNSRFPFVASS